MATAADHPPGVAEIIAAHQQAVPDPVAVALHRVADEIKALRELVHDAIVGEMVEP